MADEAINQAIINELQNLSSIMEKVATQVELLNNKPKSGGEGEGEDDEPKKKVAQQITTMGKYFQAITSVIAQFPQILSQQAADAQRFAQNTNQTFTEGAAATQQMRDKALEQAGKGLSDMFGGKTFNFNEIVRTQQIRSSMEGFTSVIGGFSEGTMASTKQFADFTEGAKKALGGTEQFRLTAEVIRAMGVAGLGSTQRLEEFRKATGLRTVSDTFLATVINKNVLGFQLFGDSFAKTAIRAEQLGISLQAVTAAARANVMNVEGMMDTVNQLNALGANIDFTELLRLQEFEGVRAPEKILEYLRSVTPTGQFSISSFAGIFEGLGFKMEDVLKIGRTETKSTESTLNELIATFSTKFEASTLTFGQKLGEIINLFSEGAPWLTKLVGAITGLTFALGISSLTRRFFMGPVPIPGGGAAPGASSVAMQIGKGVIVPVAIVAGTQIAGNMAIEEGKERIKAGQTTRGTADIIGAEAVKGGGIALGLISLGSFLAGLGVVGSVPSGGTSLALTALGMGIGAVGGYFVAEDEKEKAKAQQAVSPTTTPTAELSQLMPPGMSPEMMAQITAMNTTAINAQNQQSMALISFANGVGQFNESSTRLITKTDELINTIKAMNLPELTQTLRNASTTLNIDGRSTTVARHTLNSVNLRTSPV